MRTNMSPRAGAVGALCAASLGAMAGTAEAAPVPFSLDDASVAYGQRTVATGTVARGLAGRRASLEHRVAGGTWRAIAGSAVRPSGRYRTTARVPASGALRVTIAGTPDVSAERRFAVRARVGISSRRLDVRAGRSLRVAGTARPGRPGLPVRLEIRRGGRWAVIDRSRTRRGGAYRLSDRRGSTMSAPARVRVGGSAGLRPGTRSLGRANVYRTANASWYGPGLYGNQLGCGGTLNRGRLGVAHKSLPCGTMVTFRKGSRSVRVPVIDRGPYVGSREYDLTQATAQRLGFVGHGAVQATR